MLNDTTASIYRIIRADTDVIDAAHAYLNSVLDLADIVGPAVGACYGKERYPDLVSQFDLGKS